MRRPIQSALAASLLALAPLPGHSQTALGSLFGAGELDAQRFIVVAAPIGSGSRSQLNIYEQVSGKRPCFEVAPGKPAMVNPLLSSFDFTGICGRYIDGNGYSLRVGGSDLATVYRLSVLTEAADTLLMALPTRAGAGPEMVVGRAFGTAKGFLKLELEPGWRLMRRQFGGRSLGHLYLYRDAWPQAAANGGATPAASGTQATPAAPAAGALAPSGSVPSGTSKGLASPGTTKGLAPAGTTPGPSSTGAAAATPQPGSTKPLPPAPPRLSPIPR